jgi:hypothetical protein
MPLDHHTLPLRLRPALLFFALWMLTWAVTAVTWERDTAGYSLGMGAIAMPLHLVLPLVLGALLTNARGDPPATVVQRCALAGLGFSVLHCGVLVLVDTWWLPVVASAPPRSEFIAGTLVLLAVYGCASAGLCVIGGVATHTIRSRPHRGTPLAR